MSAAAIPLSRLVRVELSKATDTRSARAFLAITALTTIVIMLVPLLATGDSGQTWATYLGFPALVLTTLLPVVAILAVTSEWTQRTVLITFTQEPRRERVLSAKALMAVLLGAAGALFGALVTAAAVGVAALAGHQIGAELRPTQGLGYLLFVLLVMLTGVSLAALIQNTAAAVVVFLLRPTAFAILGYYVHPVGQWLDTTTTFDWVSNGEWSGHAAKIAASVAVWIVVPLAAGVVRTLRRDVT
jgi:ABC-2 type transport system permease protein